ncbi:MAG: 2-C-methyl-D-erythritol 4-phosphate cytidylyltransferase [Anaerotignum sp.]|nr:2-C-methyl-D-erythritol 4-phosphate cytidylyltransferase [Anaerotignum sp.]
MGTEISKQFLPLAGKEILAHTVERFEEAPAVDAIVLVAGANALTDVENLTQRYGWKKVRAVVEGGKERQDSVRKGLAALPLDTEIVLIHDGVRPFVTREMIENSIRKAWETGACVVGVPAKDTITVCDEGGFAVKTLDRSTLWQIQTPQTFRRELILQAYDYAQKENFMGTDDASLVMGMGAPVQVIMGDYGNIKITTQEDLLIAEAFLGEEKP